MLVSELITSLSAFDESLIVTANDGGLLPLYITGHATQSTHKELTASTTSPTTPLNVGDIVGILNSSSQSTYITINVGGSIKDVEGVELSGGVVIIEARKWFVLRGSELYLM